MLHWPGRKWHLSQKRSCTTAARTCADLHVAFALHGSAVLAPSMSASRSQQVSARQRSAQPRTTLHKLCAGDPAAAGTPVLAWLPMLCRVATVWEDYFECRHPGASADSAHAAAGSRALQSRWWRSRRCRGAMPTRAGLILTVSRSRHGHCRAFEISWGCSMGIKAAECGTDGVRRRYARPLTGCTRTFKVLGGSLPATAMQRAAAASHADLAC